MTRRRRKQDERKRELKRRGKRRDRLDPLIGYFAVRGVNVVCDGDGCIVAGSVEKMTHIIQRHHEDADSFEIRQTTYSEIFPGIQLGGAYCFDEQAYGRFLRPAQAAGLPLVDEDFSDPGPTGIHLVRVGFI